MLWVRLETEPSPDREHWAATAKGPAARELVEDAGATLSELLADYGTNAVADEDDLQDFLGSMRALLE